MYKTPKLYNINDSEIYIVYNNNNPKFVLNSVVVLIVCNIIKNDLADKHPRRKTTLLILICTLLLMPGN